MSDQLPNVRILAQFGAKVLDLMREHRDWGSDFTGQLVESASALGLVEDTLELEGDVAQFANVEWSRDLSFEKKLFIRLDGGLGCGFTAVGPFLSISAAEGDSPHHTGYEITELYEPEN